jgi:hypothetical protein
LVHTSVPNTIGCPAMRINRTKNGEARARAPRLIGGPLSPGREAPQDFMEGCRRAVASNWIQESIILIV